MVVLKNPLLIAFERVAELKTVHAAAFDIGLTQAALTKRLRLLESELEVTLFLRSRRGMTLTEEGKALLQFCKTSNEAEGQLLSSLKGGSKMQVSLTIAGPTSAISSRINKDCLSLYAKYPHLKLHFQSEDHANLIEMIRLGRVDLAVVSPNLVPNTDLLGERFGIRPRACSYLDSAPSQLQVRRSKSELGLLLVALMEFNL